MSLTRVLPHSLALVPSSWMTPASISWERTGCPGAVPDPGDTLGQLGHAERTLLVPPAGLRTLSQACCKAVPSPGAGCDPGAGFLIFCKEIERSWFQCCFGVLCVVLGRTGGGDRRWGQSLGLILLLHAALSPHMTPQGTSPVPYAPSCHWSCPSTCPVSCPSHIPCPCPCPLLGLMSLLLGLMSLLLGRILSLSHPMSPVPWLGRCCPPAWP